MKDRPLYRKNFDSEAIAIEAASWVLQLDNGPLSTADMDELREWAGRSPAHTQTLREYASTWLSIDDVLLKANEAENAIYKYSWWSTLFAIFNKRFFHVLAPLSAVLVVVLYMTSNYYLAPLPTPNIAATAITYSTRLGEQAQFKLSDGSTIHLNTGSIMEVEYQSSRRIIRLLKGEAHFDVAHDPARPFDVIASEKQITAVGTVFDIRLTDLGVNITVTEGTVIVAPAQPSAIQPSDLKEGDAKILAILEPNDKMVVESGGVTIAKVTENIIERQLSWREGVLIFEDDSLSYVIKEISRYTDIKIILTDSELEGLRIGGLFKTGEIQSLLNALELSFDLQAHKIDEKTIHLSYRTNSVEGS